METAAALKTRIVSLWGIDMDAVNIKLNELRVFLIGASEFQLLDLLLKSDLNIERAINLHFNSNSNRTPTPNPPPPSPPSPQQPAIIPQSQYPFDDSDDNERKYENNNNNNENNENDANDLGLGFNLHLTPSPTPNDDSLDRDMAMAIKLSKESEEQRQQQLRNNNNSETDSDDLEILTVNNNVRNTNNSNNNNNRNSNNSNNSRKRPFDEGMDIDGDFPRKRRKLSKMNKKPSDSLSSDDDTENNNNNNSNNSNNSNNNNSNSNSNSNISNSNNNNNNSMEIDEIPEAKYDDNWYTKVFGRLVIEYRVIGSGYVSISGTHSFVRASLTKQIEIRKINELTTAQQRLMKTHIIRELSEFIEKKPNGINVKYISKTTIQGPGNKSDQQTRAEEFERIRSRKWFFVKKDEIPEYIVELIDEQVDENLKNNKNINQWYRIEFELTLNRHQSNSSMYDRYLQRLKQTTRMRVFDTSPSYLLCALYLNNNNNNIIEHINYTNDIMNDYATKGHTFSMISLLDYSCRYEYDTNDRDENYKHKLNVRLHPYQLQSLRWMLNEERNDIGFMRNFYICLRFDDNTSFYYSALFGKLIVAKQYMPKASGGFLCEEMGLGKTIISLALINCNNNSNNYNYNRDGLIMTHTENRKKYRYQYSTNPEEAPLRIEYTETYKWYKSSATLIIGPTSLISQWEKECDDKSNRTIKYKRYYGNRKRDVKLYIGQDIIFTTYGILASEQGEDRTKHILHQIEWHRIILDESHSIKNATTSTGRSIAKLRAKNRWCLTGTPFGKHIHDIGNQLKFIGMDDSHVNKLSLKSITKQALFNGRATLASFQLNTCKPLIHVISKVIMRHKKAQKFNNEPMMNCLGMPEKTEGVLWIEFTAKQREYYNKLYNTAKERYEYYKSINNVARGSISILASLHPARQACSGHIYSKEDIELSLSTAQARTFRIRQLVSNVNPNLSSTELFDMAQEEAYDATDGECPICFECPYDDPLQTPCRHIFCRDCIMEVYRSGQGCPLCRTKFTDKQLKRPYNKDENDKKSNENGNDNNNGSDKEEKDDSDDGKIRFDSKIKRLIVELNKIRSRGKGEKSLIFTSFSKSLNWLCEELKNNNFKYRTLTGNMSLNKRGKQLKEFSDDPRVEVFVLTVRSGAVGITLTAANHVFMMEPPFNAALHRQAINRVYRLGQTKKVYIKTLIMKDSIEEKIWNINKNKISESNPKKSVNLAGNIQSDKSAKLAQGEIAQLFEDNENNNSNNNNNGE